MGFAVVGAGRIGALHARHLLGAVEGARLVMVVDIDEAAARRAGGGVVSVGRDISDALSDARVDAVVIASPTDKHVEQVQAVAAAGKAVFCEKPVAKTLADTRRALESVAAAGVPFQIGFHRRFDPAYAAVARAVAAGELGGVELFRSQSTDPAPPPEEYVAVSGGFYRDSVVHDLDAARFIAGEVTHVTALGRVLVDDRFKRQNDVDTSVVTLEFESGALGVVMNSRRTDYGHDLRIEVHGSVGKLVAEDERATKVWRYDKAGFHADFFGHFLTRFRDAYRLEMEAFTSALRSGKSPAPGPRDAIESLRLAEAAQASLESGGRVAVAEIGA
ncbi:MAG: inositol 2-dehydrogenase [Trueperaceae bacterium]|nr:inositol 2-dehydrogenase [Trueperaceae bacterium]